MESPFTCARDVYEQRKSTYTNTTPTILDKDDRIYMGALGECMFRWDLFKCGFEKYVLHWNREWKKGKSHDGGWDFELPVGKVDVKTSFSGDLFVSVKAKRADMYAVYAYSKNNAVFSGWLWGWDVKNKGTVQYKNGRESYLVPKDRLNGDFRDLLDECEWAIEKEEL